MATESDVAMEDLDCNLDSVPLHNYDGSQVQQLKSVPVDRYDKNQIQQLLRLTESLMEQGQTLNGEIDAILADDGGQLRISESYKSRFMFIVTQVVFVIQQALLVFPELFEGPSVQSGAKSLTWRLLQDDELDIDSLLIQYFLTNRQNCLAGVRFMQLEDGTWVRPKSRFYFYKFFLDLYDNGRWQDIMKMSQQTFFWLCDKMAPHIRKSDTNYRQAIPVPCRLAACIYKLVTGCRSAEIMSKFGIGRSTLYSILRQVIPGIIEVLGCHIGWPTGPAFQETINGIREVCSFPNCGGIVGGCDIPIVAPTEDPWAYMNVNQEYSVVLQVVCNHERKFTSVNVGKAGSMEYSGVLRSSSLFKRANCGGLLSEDPFILPCGSQIGPYLLADLGYPCLEWLLTPYRGSSSGLLGPMQGCYNEKLHQGRGLVDQSFAMLKSTFAELATPCLLDIELVPQMIGACCVLHNILIDRADIKAEDLVVWNAQQALVREHKNATFEAEMDQLEENPEALIKRDTLAYYLANLPCVVGRETSSSANPFRLDEEVIGSSSHLPELDQGDLGSSPSLPLVDEVVTVSSPNLPQLDDGNIDSLTGLPQLDHSVLDPSLNMSQIEHGTVILRETKPHVELVVTASSGNLPKVEARVGVSTVSQPQIDNKTLVSPTNLDSEIMLSSGAL